MTNKKTLSFGFLLAAVVAIAASVAYVNALPSPTPPAAASRAELALAEHRILPAGAKAVDVNDHQIAVTLPDVPGGTPAAARVAAPARPTPNQSDPTASGTTSSANAVDGTYVSTTGPGYNLMWPDTGLLPNYNVRATTGTNVLNVLWYVIAASGQVNTLTGSTFTYVGQSGTPQPANGEITVTVASSLPCSSSTAVGCTVTYATSTEIVGAAIYVLSSWSAHASMPTIAAHELGHAVGLNHFNETYNGEYQRMYYTTRNDTAYTFKSGDQAGLRKMGSFLRSTPFGSVDAAAATRGAFKTNGWAIDPNTINPINVDVVIDGTVVVSAPANATRTDVGTAYPNFGSNHGFNYAVRPGGGSHQACMIARNVGYGENKELRCVNFTIDPAPFGALNTATGGTDNVTLTGWAIDPDTDNAINVRVSVDGVTVATVAANAYRTDVASANKPFSAYHGLSTTVPASAGTRQVCLTAVNVSGGADTSLGCMSVTVTGSTTSGPGTTTPPPGDASTSGPSPFGAVESLKKSAGTSLTVTGWAIDPSTTSSIMVRIVVDGKAVANVMANGTRTDLSQYGLGTAHGFRYIFATSKGKHSVCVVAVNVGTGSDRELGCLTARA